MEFQNLVVSDLIIQIIFVFGFSPEISLRVNNNARVRYDKKIFSFVLLQNFVPEFPDPFPESAERFYAVSRIVRIGKVHQVCAAKLRPLFGREDFAAVWISYYSFLALKHIESGIIFACLSLTVPLSVTL